MRKDALASRQFASREANNAFQAYTKLAVRPTWAALLVHAYKRG